MHKKLIYIEPSRAGFTVRQYGDNLPPTGVLLETNQEILVLAMHFGMIVHPLGAVPSPMVVDQYLLFDKNTFRTIPDPGYFNEDSHSS